MNKITAQIRPTRDALGATNASSATWGFLSKRFINGLCLVTAHREQTSHESELAESHFEIGLPQERDDQVCMKIDLPDPNIAMRM
jgi:hypothetical protein